ncbi:SLC13 family permease [Methyloprofundus sp.]|uniref:SLC13 family permease n=1 Tax=Methyloprofundus sp. TaxID=2020875 RepID=UPI003D09EF8C
MPIDLITVAIILFCALILLASNRFPPDSILLGVLGLLLISGILTPTEALSGFASPGMATIAVLYVTVAGLRETGSIAWLGRLLLGRPANMTLALIRLLLPAATISMFINNSPVVAMFTSAVQDWCKRSGFSASNFLLPLSYASIMGGTCSLIGTSTNLVVDGLMRQSGHSGFGLFEIASVGLPITIVGCVYLIIVSPLLIKNRVAAIEKFGDVREYLVEMLVNSNCELSGLTIQDAGLRHLPGLFLIEIVRDGDIIPVVSPQTVIQSDDRLVFAGAVDSVVELRRIRGLVVASDQIFKLEGLDHERRLFEAVISAESPVAGLNIREARFRHRYNAVILSIARNGYRLKGKIGDIELQAGDTLLLEAQKGFLFKFRNSRDFLLVSKLENSSNVRHNRAPWAISIMVLMILLIVSGTMNILPAAVLAAGAMLASACLNMEDARNSIDYKVLLVIASAYGLGTAVLKVGLADMIAGQALLVANGDPLMLLALIYISTALLTETITNNAAAIVMFPIAMSGAQSLDVSTAPFAIAVMIAASASFITPIGYQTNLMVFGPGGYRFSDYVKLGLPLSILVAGIALWIIPQVWVF